MGPKNAQAKTQKVVEDKTFGMKNKKGKKQQEFIKQVQKNAENKFKVTSKVCPIMVLMYCVQ